MKWVEICLKCIDLWEPDPLPRTVKSEVCDGHWCDWIRFLGSYSISIEFLLMHLLLAYSSIFEIQNETINSNLLAWSRVMFCVLWLSLSLSCSRAVGNCKWWIWINLSYCYCVCAPNIPPKPDERKCISPGNSIKKTQTTNHPILFA